MTGLGLRRIRKELGLTQVAFARRLGVKRLSIIRWEMGHRAIAEPIVRLVRFLHAEVRGTATGKRKGKSR